MAGKKQNYTDEFKKQIVELRKSGNPASVLSKEYGLARSIVCKWYADYTKTGSFKAKDNRSEEENELIALKKHIKQLEMENDILKQVALIMGRK